ncbi:oxidoreductase-1 [Coleophoma crateriformis]|uniref:Oxidoreductase-1 n=1 Tax=Coleophoma crateriformis TaxID=565419 RepID=A0A3D8QFP4_9HELO|nr:oxidoreductase-1 [Coleophoma crateriformis]
MAPIKVGFIGLSKSGWAPGAHLPFLQQSEQYQIVAVQNSSVASAKEAIQLYKLPEGTKAYGDPQDIANDPNIDLVVCSVRVDRHHAAIAPSLKAGKDVYVEWPLGKSLADAEDLLKLKNEHGVKKAVVGLQARQAPIISKIKELIGNGAIGDVLSSTWSACAIHLGSQVTSGMLYFMTKDIGGNLLTIHFGHGVDYVQNALGSYFELDSVRSLLAIRQPFLKLVDDSGKVVNDKVPKDTHDTMGLSAFTKSGIPVTLTMRSGTPYKGTSALDWRIYGTKGEIRITASGPFIQIGYPDQKIEVHDFAKDEVKEIEVKDEWEDLAMPARNVTRVYEGLLGKEGNVDLLCSFEDAVERHRLCEKMYEQNP